MMRTAFFCLVFILVSFSGIGQSKKSLPWTYRRPLFADGNGGKGENILWHSVLSRHVEGLPCGSWVSCSASRGYTALVMNYSIKDLYQLAYAMEEDSILSCLEIPESRTLLYAKDSSKYVSDIGGVPHPENTYTYQLWAPPTSFTELKQKMQQDLKRYFGLEVEIKKKKMKCWVLTAEDTALIATRGGKFDKKTQRHKGLMIKNLPFSWLVRTLHENIEGSPIIDEVRYKGHIDIDLEADLADPLAIDRALQHYKMRLRQETRKIDVLILKEPKEGKVD